MKKLLTSLSVIFFSLLLITKSFAQSGAIVGGELISVHVADSTYQLFLKLYITCNTNTTDSLDVCFEDTCNNINFSQKMAKWTGTGGGCLNFTTGCPNVKTTCDSSGSNIQGYQQCWYSTIVTLPTRCNSWRSYVSINSRAGVNNISNANNNNFYAEVKMNNSFRHNNSSPFYSLTPAIYVQTNQPFTYNVSARDTDNDSLVTKLIMARTANTGCSVTPTDLTLSSSSYNLSNNPFPTGNSFALNSQNGLYSFTPTQAGIYSLVFETSEYRNGIKLGSVIRELPVTVFGSGPTIQYGFGISNVIGGNLVGGDTILACINQNLSFDFFMSSSDTAAELNMQDSKNITATTSYQNQQTDTVSGSFSWTPTNSNVGIIQFFVVDSICRIPASLGINIDSVIIIPTLPDTPHISITVSPDSNIVQNTIVTFTATDTGCTAPQYQWTLNGTDINGETAATFTSSTLNDGDVVACRIACLVGCTPPPIGDSISNSITMHVSSGINDNVKSNSFKIYPNPNHGIFTISLPEKVVDGTLYINNSIGQNIYKEDIDDHTQTFHIGNNVTSGIYFLKVNSNQGIFVSRLVINK